MEKGDLSNDMPPRVLVVGNDFLIKTPINPPVLFGGKMFGRTKRIVDTFEIDMDVRAVLHDVTWRRGMRVDVVMIGWTKQMCELLSGRFDVLNLAVSQVYPVSDVQELVKRLAYMPEVLWVAHGRPDWNLTFGPRSSFGTLGLQTI